MSRLMAGIRVPWRGPGRAGTWASRVVADEGCSSTRIRTHLRRWRTQAAIPERNSGSPWQRGAKWTMSSKWDCRVTLLIMARPAAQSKAVP